MTLPEPEPVPHDPVKYLRDLRKELEKIDGSVHGLGSRTPDKLAEDTLRELANAGLISG